MQVKDVMTNQVVRVGPEETVAAAARLLARRNVGAVPVCSKDGRLRGMVTDRDLVLRCIAPGLDPDKTTVSQVMTKQVCSVSPDMELPVAAHLMGRQQVRRLPVTEKGLLCGLLSLGDMACREESLMDAADALTDIVKAPF